MPQSPTANELEYQAITLTHILVRFEDEWLPEHTQLVRTCLFVCMRVNIKKFRNYKGIQFMRIEHLGTQIQFFILLPKTTLDEIVRFKDGRHPEEKQFSKKKKNLMPGIAHICQWVLLTPYGWHIFVRLCPGLEHTTAGLDG